MGRTSAHPTDIYVGQVIKKRRVFLDMSQDTLAKSIGITFQQIQKYENGSNRVGASRLLAIAKELGVTPNYFFPLSQYIQTDQDGLTRQEIKLIKTFRKITSPDLKNKISAMIYTVAKAEKS